jgi:hypothetical protein
MKRLLIAFALSCLLPFSIQAAEFSMITEGNQGHPATLLMQGKLEQAETEMDVAKFLNVAAPQRYGAVLYLDSLGGNVATALRIGELIRLYGFSTAVINVATCNSACGLIWISAKERFLSSRAAVGFHAAFYYKTYTTKEIHPLANMKIRAYLFTIGIQPNAVDYLTEADPTSLNFVTLKTASAYGIDVKQFPDEPVVAPAPVPAFRPPPNFHQAYTVYTLPR